MAMIQTQLKLRLSGLQEQTINDWLWNLTGVYNWASRKIELDAKDKIFHTPFAFVNLLANHSKKLGVPSHTIQAVTKTVYDSWQRCFKKKGGRPRLKSNRRKLNSIPFPDVIKAPELNRVQLPGLGSIRFHKQDIPEGRIKCGRIVKRASGWYLCLFIDAERKAIQHTGRGEIGIDPGFKDLLTLSTGQKIANPKELQQSARRLAQAQRGINRKQVALLHEKIANQRKDRNHKLSLKLVQENITICFSKDNIKGIAKKFGKSVASSAHAQLRSMISYKSLAGGTRYIEVASKNSTRACSACGCLNGPTGLAGLSVRQWTCMDCGSLHDRDVNAAINTLYAGAGIALERVA
jgi:transposase